MPGPASLQVFQHVVLTDAIGVRHISGAMNDPANLSASFAGECRHQTFSVDGGDQVNPELGNSFSFLWVRVNAEDCFLEVTTDVNDSVGRQSQTFKLRKNLAFVIGSGVSYADFTTNFGGGTLDVIDRVVILNNGSETVAVEVIVAE